MFKKGMRVEFTNKLSGSHYEGEIIQVKLDMIVVLDDCENVFQVPFKYWDISILEN